MHPPKLSTFLITIPQPAALIIHSTNIRFRPPIVPLALHVGENERHRRRKFATTSSSSSWLSWKMKSIRKRPALHFVHSAACGRPAGGATSSRSTISDLAPPRIHDRPMNSTAQLSPALVRTINVANCDVIEVALWAKCMTPFNIKLER